MNDRELLDLCADEAFATVTLVDMDDVVFEPAFRPFCEQNLCGQYGANYSCPPDCGTPEAMEAQLRRYRRAVVFQSKWDIDNWYDETQIKRAKKTHNAAMLRAIRRMKDRGLTGVMAGASCCNLCERCARRDDKPCPYPDARFSCLSAYCVYVKALAETCGMEYVCSDGSLAFFGMFAFP